MRSARTVLAAITFLTSFQLAFAKSDFEQYVEKIRQSGMTEGAEGDFRQAASILSGGTTLQVTHEPDGSLGRSYTSTLCFRPGADPEKLHALREKIEAKVTAWMSLLKKYADTDASGYVNSDEGWKMRSVVELGLLVSQVPEIKNLDDLAKAVHEKREKVVQDLSAYEKLQTAAVQHGLVGIPSLPQYLSGSNRARG